MKFTYAPEASPLPGLRIKRGIDRGGFGEVYFAVTDSGKELAIKLLQRNEEIELRGVRACLNLKHPNLLPIYDIRTDADGNHWVLMEFVSGPSLQQLLRQHPAGLPLPEVQSWLQGMAAGLQYLHDRGLVHRDLKPANIFRESGVVKLGDVGLCKSISPSRRSQHTESVGTVYYMAPEVSRGRYTQALDLYSLGVIAYEMVTGSVPFDGETTGEILMKHLATAPDLRLLPASLRGVIGQALEKDPELRHRSAMEFADQFRQALQSEKPSAERSDPVRVASTPSQEIPASHFVDVEHVEQQARARRGLEQPWARDDFAETTIHPPAPSNRAPSNPLQHLWNQVESHPVLSMLLGMGAAMFFLSMMRLRVSPVESVRVLFFPGWVIWAGLGYLVYRSLNSDRRESSSRTVPARAGRGSGRKSSPEPGPQRRAPVRPEPGPVRAVAQRAPRRETAAATPVVFPLAGRERVAGLMEALGSAGFSTALLSLAAWLWGSLGLPQTPGMRQITGSVPGVALFGLSTLVASWMALIPARLMETTGWGWVPRRMAQVAAGACGGLLISWMSARLLIELNGAGPLGPPLLTEFGDLPLIDGHHSLSPGGFAVWLAGLLGFAGWGRLAESQRKRSFSWASVLWMGLVAAGLSKVFVFDQRWGTWLAVAAAIVVQLAPHGRRSGEHLSAPSVPPGIANQHLQRA